MAGAAGKFLFFRNEQNASLQSTLAVSFADGVNGGVGCFFFLQMQSPRIGKQGKLLMLLMQQVAGADAQCADGLIFGMTLQK